MTAPRPASAEFEKLWSESPERQKTECQWAKRLCEWFFTAGEARGAARMKEAAAKVAQAAAAKYQQQVLVDEANKHWDSSMISQGRADMADELETAIRALPTEGEGG